MKTAILETPLHRMIEVAGIEGPIVLTISPAGVTFRLKHSQKEVATTWDKVIAMCDITHPHVPTYLVNEPFSFLQVVAQQMKKRKKSRQFSGCGPGLLPILPADIRSVKAMDVDRFEPTGGRWDQKYVTVDLLAFPASYPAFNPALTDFLAIFCVKIIKDVVYRQTFRG